VALSAFVALANLRYINALNNNNKYSKQYTRARAHLTALYRDWILLKLETVSGSGASWAVCKSAPRSKQITMPAPHHSFFYRPDALPATQPTASKHLGSKAHLPPHRWTTLPRLRTKFGERAFSHAGPATWNHIRTVADPVTFRKLLKSHCFSQAFNT